MGVGGKFWDLLRPYARQQGFDFLRDKWIAVDLSFWIVQHETALKGVSVLKPHLRLTFFRTITLFSKFGAYPVFVVDGTPSPLKSQTRISRFFRSSGIDASSLPDIKDGVSVERNKLFCEWVRECVELLELLGIPVVKAKGEAEALCAQLNSEGYVDACITPDSDAFLFGATCVIKSIKPNSREPFECYYMSDIEAGLSLKRKHLIAMSLLVGNDYDTGGVLGIGVDKALRIVRMFSEDDILERLQDIGKGWKPDGIKSVDESSCSEMKKRDPHCSRCGHPGNKRAHSKSSCQHCSCDSGCIEKPLVFRCECSFCSKKEETKSENWWIKVCDKIALEPDFPNKKIIELYLSDSFTEDIPSMSWKTPDTEMLKDFMVYELRWDPSYIRKMVLPMLSTIYLRERALKKTAGNTLLCDQYQFHSIKSIKTRNGHQSFVIRWRKPISTSRGIICDGSEPEELIEEDEEEEGGVDDTLEGLNEPQVEDNNGDLLTDESIELVQSAFPDETEHFLSLKKKKKNVCEVSSTTPTMGGGLQTSISDFYRSTKAGEASSSEKKRQQTSTSSSTNKLSKSVRRRLLFG